MTFLIRPWKQFASKVKSHLTLCTDEEETNFSNVLLVHQALGQGVFNEVENPQKRSKKKLEKRLQEMVSLSGGGERGDEPSRSRRPSGRSCQSLDSGELF